MLPPNMRVKAQHTALMLVVLMLASTAGCLSTDNEDDGNNPITMNVHYDATSGVLTERIQDNTVLSQSGVDLAFDFARVSSKAGMMKTFSLDPGDDVDGANAITVNANEQAEIGYTYMTHGLFSVVLSATDENGNEAALTITVRIDKEIDWSQTNTENPDSMAISTVPDCVCEHPEKITIDSTVSNPQDLVPGTQVTVTWHLNDPDEEQQAFHTEQIGDGQEGQWPHSQYNVGSGAWSLDVTIDSGNDSISMSHLVNIMYEALETDPNPLEIETPAEEEDSV